MKNKGPHLLSNLPAYSEDGAVHAVVEAPKGSFVKLKYEIKLGAFTVAHSLPLGLSYPFDWGFVPSTQAPDGDPFSRNLERTRPRCRIAHHITGLFGRFAQHASSQPIATDGR